MSDVGIAASPAKTKKIFAKKDFLDATGKVVAIDEGAVALRYTTLSDETSETFEIAKAPPEVILMGALYGFSALFTIEATRNRDLVPGDEGYFASDTDAVRARWARIEPGNWGLKPSAGRLSIDVDLLLAAVDETLPGVITDKAEFLEMLKTNDSLRNDLRWNEDVAPTYDKKIREKRLAASASAPKTSAADAIKAALAAKKAA